MADEPTTTETQPGETPAVVTPPPAGETPAATTTTTTTTTDPEPFDADRARRTIETQREAERKAKADAKDAKARADAAEARVKELESASMSEQEKRDAAEREKSDRLTALEREREQWAVERKQSRLELMVLRLYDHDDIAIIDPDVALRMVDTALIEFDERGEPDEKSVVKALKALVEAKPALKRSTTAQTSMTTNPSRAQVAPAKETSDQRLDRLYRRGDSIFDSAKAREMGGGVVITERQV